MGVRIIKCPRCQKELLWSSAEPYRPFCSERCQQIDLGAWASEAYAFPAESIEDTTLPSNDAEDE